MANGHRVFARVWDWMSRHEGKREQRFREEVVSGAKGKTLELGYGVGSNWPFLPEDVDYTGIEPDPCMRARAEDHKPGNNTGLRALEGDAQSLDFADGTFDTVIATLVFCTIPDPDAALAESLRVLKPGGEFRFWEHVRGRGKGARLQDMVTPAWKRLGGGCHPNRDTLSAIQRAGFEVTQLREVKIGPLPAIVGVATRPTGD
jgi:SAM-dependent methyltransferase